MRLFAAALSCLSASLLLLATSAQTSVCASTPEAAAAAAFVGTPATTTFRDGYRVQDVQVDALTKRIWARVRRCDNDVAPPLLVLMQASLGSPVRPTPQGRAAEAGAAQLSLAEVPPPPSPTTSPAAPAHVLAVHSGDAIRVVMNSPSIRMEMEGKALQQAALGESIEVELRRTGDEPAHRILGTLRANHTVEVQP